MQTDIFKSVTTFIDHLFKSTTRLGVRRALDGWTDYKCPDTLKCSD